MAAIYYYQPNCTDKEIESHLVSNLPKVSYIEKT